MTNLRNLQRLNAEDKNLPFFEVLLLLWGGREPFLMVLLSGEVGNMFQPEKTPRHFIVNTLWRSGRKLPLGWVHLRTLVGKNINKGVVSKWRQNKPTRRVRAVVKLFSSPNPNRSKIRRDEVRRWAKVADVPNRPARQNNLCHWKNCIHTTVNLEEHDVTHRISAKFAYKIPLPTNQRDFWGIPVPNHVFGVANWWVAKICPDISS